MSCWKETQWKMASDIDLVQRCGFRPGDTIEGREWAGEPRPVVKILRIDHDNSYFPIVVDVVSRPGLMFQRPREAIEEGGITKLSLRLRDWRKVE